MPIFLTKKKCHLLDFSLDINKKKNLVFWVTYQLYSQLL